MESLNLPTNHTLYQFEAAVKQRLDEMADKQERPLVSHELSRRVFLVHGRNESAKQEVRTFLEQQNLEVVVLADQPNMGRTIIEKFEQTANVGYAIVLATPDDIGRLRDEDGDKARARQNVIFELGYFVGKLGRDKVCLLHVPNVEIPSDFYGVGFVRFCNDDDSWKRELIRELKAAGMSGKWNTQKELCP